MGTIKQTIQEATPAAQQARRDKLIDLVRKQDKTCAIPMGRLGYMADAIEREVVQPVILKLEHALIATVGVKKGVALGEYIENYRKALTKDIEQVWRDIVNARDREIEKLKTQVRDLETEKRRLEAGLSDLRGREAERNMKSEAFDTFVQGIASAVVEETQRRKEEEE